MKRRISAPSIGIHLRELRPPHMRKFRCCPRKRGKQTRSITCARGRRERENVEYGLIRKAKKKSKVQIRRKFTAYQPTKNLFLLEASKGISPCWKCCNNLARKMYDLFYPKKIRKMEKRSKNILKPGRIRKTNGIETGRRWSMWCGHDRSREQQK